VLHSTLKNIYFFQTRANETVKDKSSNKIHSLRSLAAKLDSHWKVTNQMQSHAKWRVKKGQGPKRHFIAVI